MVRQQQPGLAGVADQFEEAAQALRIVKVRGRTGEGRQVAMVGMHLGQDRAPQALLAGAETDQPQFALDFAVQQRGQLLTHVGDRRERGDHQRHRRHALVRLALVVPLRLHRQRVLADRDADVQLRAQLHAHRLHRVVQQCVFARVAGRGHPVRRQLDFVQRVDRGRAQVGQCFAYRHARRRRRVQQGQRRALTQRHRFAGHAIEVGQGDRHVGHRQLPRTDHLLARGQAADAAVTDGDQEVLRGDRRMRQHAQTGVLQVQARGVQRRPARCRRVRGIAVHLRRLAEQHVHRQVDRCIGRDVARHGTVGHHQVFFGGGYADRGERAALACAQRGELGQALLRHTEHIALLRLVAPQLHRRQRRIIGRHLAQVDDAADPRVMQQFGDGVGQATGTDVMEELDRVVGAHRHAAIDDFLAATLHFRVVALHAGEIQVFGAFAGSHRTGRTAAEADQHCRAAQHDDGVAIAQQDLVDLHAVDRAEAAGQHDRLVVGTHQVGALGQLEAAEVTEQGRAAELVVERGAAERAVGHDFQRRRHPRIQRARGFPRLRQLGDAQMRDREAGQAGLGLAAAAGGALVADFAAGTGRCPRERRDRGRVVVRFHLDLERARHLRFTAVLAAGRIRTVARGRMAFDHRSVVAIRAERVLRCLLVGVLDHPEQRAILLLAVDGPAGVEDLVAAVLGIGLREHHQFHVRRRTAQRGEAIAQVVDLVLGHGQAEALVGGLQLVHRHAFQFTPGRRREQRLALFHGLQHRLRHRVVQRLDQRLLGGGIGRPALYIDAQATLDPAHRLAGTADQLGGLARPRRQRAQARHHDAADRTFGHVLGLRPGFEDAAQGVDVGAGAFGLHEVDVPGTADAQGGSDGLQAGFKTFAAERRQGGRALEDHHVRGTVVGKRARYCTGSGGWALAGRRPAPAQATATATATARAKAGLLWAGGAVGASRTRRKPIHGGSMAPSMAPTVLLAPTAPPPTVSRWPEDPRHAWMNLCLHETKRFV